MAFYPAMTMEERILFVRENCGDLSQEEFANKLGLTKSAISGYETGRRVPPDNVIKHIACVFDIDEDWLRDGVGEPFFPTPDDALEELFDQFECSDFERSFLLAYSSLKDKDRRIFSNYLDQIFHAMIEERKTLEARRTSSKSDTKTEFEGPPDIAAAEALYESSSGFVQNTGLSASNTTGDTASPNDNPKEETTEENGGGESGNDVG